MNMRITTEMLRDARDRVVRELEGSLKEGERVTVNCNHVNGGYQYYFNVIRAGDVFGYQIKTVYGSKRAVLECMDVIISVMHGMNEIYGRGNSE